jgi:uncharacterized circularly permuted ATP-grasp superfamily protein/uncharacterized alpha-E superfamily protein
VSDAGAAARGAVEDLIGGYAARVSGFDAMWDHGGGQPRARWRALLRSLEQLGPGGLEERRREARRLFRENGVTYSVSGDEVPARLWQLDPVPFVVTPEEWAHIEAGIAQRARLLDIVLRDLYGRRQLIRDGHLPAELVFRHPGFLLAADRSLDAVRPALAIYAADVARGPDGAFHVVGDRTQAPTGFGYALESRIACSRLLSGVVREHSVQRLAAFFRTVQTALIGGAPNRKLDPRAVVLSPGPVDATYFDHAYLASYLGFSLVEGQDLTVREGHLWLKTVEGLKLVDIVIRRLRDWACDPLELDGDSLAGVPGLLEASRRGNVLVANPLGASILENPGLAACLPQVARNFLGEELILRAPHSAWCGDALGFAWVNERLDALVVREIGGTGSWFGPRLGPRELGSLRRRLRLDPGRYVGEEVLAWGTTPALGEHALEPACVVTRVFAAAGAGGFAVMPGGFTRVAPGGDVGVRMADSANGVCKDTWVLAPDAERHLVQWPATAPERSFIAVRESLPSRAAEALYWVGRYAERAESTARLARVLWNKSHDVDDYADPADLACVHDLRRALLDLVGRGTDLDALDADRLVRELLSARARGGAIAGSIELLARNANAVRDRWSPDTWRLVDDLSQGVDLHRRAGAAELPGAVKATLDATLSRLVAFAGLTHESMTHEDGWRFLMAGRRIERLRNLVSLLRSTLVPARDEAAAHQLLEGLLQACESAITHRRRYRVYLAYDSVIELLLLDEANPRSLAAQLDLLDSLVQSLPRQRDIAGRSDEERAVLEAHTAVRLTDVQALAAARADGERAALDALLKRVEHLTQRAEQALTHSYFAHVSPRQLVPQELK